MAYVRVSGMVQAFAVTQIIDRPVEQVWKHLTDWSAGPAWLPGVESMHADGETAVDTPISFRTRGKEQTSTITELTPERSVTLTSTQGPVTAAYAYTLERLGDDRTRISLIADVEVRGPLALTAPALRRAIKRTDNVQLDRLKAHIEQAGL
jgi:carbon monoxide dehydrogenase subunit G